MQLEQTQEGKNMLVERNADYSEIHRIAINNQDLQEFCNYLVLDKDFGLISLKIKGDG